MNKQIETFVKSTGSVVEIVAKVGGWTTCLTADGRHIKVRNGDVATREVEVAPVVVEQSDEQQAAKGKSVVAKEYRAGYVVDRDNRNASGRESVHNGDVVASMLTGLTLKQLYVAAGSLGIAANYDHLNNGMQRMNLGNRIRKQLADGSITVADIKRAVDRAERLGE